jgi:Cd(II)/Pb(II)-responsive transcriptional regulator
MKIGDLARKTGCKVVTIRYYEKEGLLAKPERSEGNYRLYGREDLKRLEFIMRCRRHGIKLEETRQLLAFKDRPQRDCTWVTKLIEAHIKNLDEQVASLKHLKKHLKRLRHYCAGGHDGNGCGIMQSLNSSDTCCASCPDCLLHSNGRPFAETIRIPAELGR